MEQFVLQVEVHVIDTRHGIWCPRCSLPSVVESDIALCWPDTLEVWHRFTGSICTSCD